MHVLDDGICVTCQPHELVDGQCVTCNPVEASRNFNPSLHPHDPHNGEFIGTPGGAVKDVLKAVTGKSALEAAPLKVGKYGFDRGDSPADVDAFHFYSGHGYIQINSLLRNNRSLSGDGRSEWTVAQIDTAMQHSRLTHDVQVHRGVGSLSMFGSHKGSLVGLEFKDNAYASTTADVNVASEMLGSDSGAILHIRVPTGTGAVQLSDVGRKSRGTRLPEHEAELLLDRGLTYRVVGDRTVKGVRQLDVEVIHE